MIWGPTTMTKVVKEMTNSDPYLVFKIPTIKAPILI
jgi:hypothetical protein